MTVLALGKGRSQSLEAAHTTSGPAAGRHFAGVNMRLLTRYLTAHTRPGTLEDVLRHAGETRDPGELDDDMMWSSYDQFRRMLEAAAAVLGGPSGLAAVGANSPIDSGSRPGVTEMLQAQGSPAAMYAGARLGSAGLFTVVDVDSEEAGPNEWVIRCRFKDGFEPFKEFCWFNAGLWALGPRMFGLPAGEVTEEECQCEGAPACSFRARWQATEDPAQRAEYFELRNQLLEARLEALQRTVADLVSDDDLEDVLRRIVASAARAVRAPSYVLAIEALPLAARHHYAVGLDEADAARVAGELLSRERRSDTDRLVVDVASTRCHYGVLAAIDPDGGRFLPQELGILEAYGRLAAAALDSASALQDARRQATTARVLLELSVSLAEISGTEEMAATLARVIPAVIDCDRAAVLLVDPDTGVVRVAASCGYPPDVEARLHAEPVSATVESGRADDGIVLGGTSEFGSVGVARVPIVVDGDRVGWIVATVTERPERLRENPELAERLRGLAGQATTALRNARLLDRIRYQATHDDLTGLPNRVLIHDRVEQMLVRARRQRISAAAMFIDLDGFKDVNDAWGHTTGDRLLQAVVARLGVALRQSDTIGRLGGDEFIVLVEGASLDAGPEVVAQRLLDVLREPFRLEGRGGRPLAITASIGVAVGDRTTGTDLLRDADVALYAAKASGKNRYVVFEPEMQTVLSERLELETDLQGALDGGQFFLVYQLIFDLRNVEVTGVEALLRWRHPTRGVIQPDVFVPLLEDTGMMVDIGRWVLRTACRRAGEWQAKGYVLDMSVNVSARQLQDDGFVGDVAEALAMSRLDPARLIVEVTESAIRRDTEGTARRLKSVREFGVRVAIDDFGTGYSSLAYLSQFPVDAVKIDRSFITAIASSVDAAALIHVLVQLGKTLGLETLAEGIEEHDQLSQLEGEHCDRGQGFLLARPLDADAVEDFLASRVPRPNAQPVGT
ncbi:MAG TPA: EAL domain-containing protein [Acidimicrobiales bacterium]|nr:EAL domain-containing protein [Acidimicrobiales bacterium]